MSTRTAPLEVVFAPKDLPQERRSGKVHDLSDEGFFIATNCLWPPATAIALVLTLPGDRFPVSLNGEVVSAQVREPAGMRVRFADPADHPTREKLRARAAAPASPRPAAAGPKASDPQ